MADTEQQKAEQRKRLKELLAASAGIFRIRIERFIERAQSPEVMAEIEAALEGNNPTAAISIIQNQVETLRPVVAEAFIEAGKEAAEEVAAMPGIAEEAAAAAGGAGGSAGGGGATGTGGEFIARLGIVFDPTNPRAAEIVRKETDLFLKDMTETQIESTRAALARAFDQGLGPRATAAAIRDSIGLTDYQLGIVANYEDALRRGSQAALDYQLRNQGRDGTVQAAIDGRRVLAERDIKRMVDQYRKNMLRFRAETIARTESTRVTSLARDETYRQLAAKLGIGNNRLIRVWRTTEDDRVREWHDTMDDQEAALGQPFIDGLGNELLYPGDPSAPPETVINCRCTLTMRIADR